MKKILAGVLAAALACAGLFGGGVRAQDRGDQRQAPATRTEVKKSVLTNDTLKEMLDNLGYQYETTRSTNGTPMYLIRMTRDGWDFNVYVSLSGDGSNVWVSAPLQDIPEGMSDAEPLLKLLGRNGDLNRNFFSLKGKRLYLETVLPNQDLKPAQLRQAVDDTLGNVKASHDLWNTDTWVKKAEPKVTRDNQDK